MHILYFIVFPILIIALFILKLISSSKWNEIFSLVSDNPEWVTKMNSMKNSMRGVNIKAVIVSDKEIVSAPINIQSYLLKKRQVDRIFGILFLITFITFFSMFFINK